MRSRTTMLTVAAATALALAASGAARPRDTGLSCDLVSPAEIKAVLGATVAKPDVHVFGKLTMCSYSGDKSVLIRFETGMSRGSFATENESARNGAHMKPFSGLGLPAYSQVIGSGPSAFGTIAALKGSTELLVTGQFPVARIEVLVKRILPDI